jgi:SOS-response transcriptional repressor LexA
MAHGVTPRQSVVLDWIRSYIRQNDGISPSYDEIGEGIGATKGEVHRLVGQLARRGHISFSSNMARSIAIIDQEPNNPANIEASLRTLFAEEEWQAVCRAADKVDQSVTSYIAAAATAFADLDLT